MIDFSLTGQQVLLQKTARDFAQKEIRPIAEEIERGGHGDTRPWDACREMFRKAARMGFMALLIPEEYGGGGGTCVDSAILHEELGAADVGIAADLFNLTIGLPQVIVRYGTLEQRQNWLAHLASAEEYPLALAATENDVAGAETFCPHPDARLGLKTSARREGNEYVIDGAKSSFVSNSGVAGSYFLACRTDPGRPASEGASLFYVPAETPGLSVGKRTAMLGMRTSQQAEVYLDNTRLPLGNLIGREGEAAAVLAGSTGYLTVGLAACYVGLARTAFEYARDFAKLRRSWGEPIKHHQAVALNLAEMHIGVEAARLMVWHAAWAIDAGDALAGAVKAPAAKTFAVDTAIKTAENAVRILGGCGLSREYPVEKYLRDAWMGYHCDSSREVLHLRIAELL